MNDGYDVVDNSKKLLLSINFGEGVAPGVAPPNGAVGVAPPNGAGVASLRWGVVPGVAPPYGAANER